MIYFDFSLFFSFKELDDSNLKPPQSADLPAERSSSQTNLAEPNHHLEHPNDNHPSNDHPLDDSHSHPSLDNHPSLDDSHPSLEDSHHSSLEDSANSLEGGHPSHEDEHTTLEKIIGQLLMQNGEFVKFVAKTSGSNRGSNRSLGSGSGRSSSGMFGPGGRRYPRRPRRGLDSEGEEEGDYDNLSGAWPESPRLRRVATAQSPRLVQRSASLVSISSSTFILLLYR